MATPPGWVPDAPPAPSPASGADAPSPPAPPDPLCLVCGYNLHDLRNEQACPECGAPVGPSRHRALADADPAWLGRLRGGLRWLLVTEVAYWGVSRLWFGWEFDAMWLSPWVWEAIRTSIDLLLLLLLAAWVWGAWQLTTPEPQPTERRAELWRRAARFSLPVGAGFEVLTIVIPLLERFDCEIGWSDDAFVLRRTVVLLCAYTGGSVGQAALYLWLRAQARRAAAFGRATVCLVGVAAAAVDWILSGLVMLLALALHAGFDVTPIGAVLVDPRCQLIRSAAAAFEIGLLVLVYALINRAWRVARRRATLHEDPGPMPAP